MKNLIYGYVEPRREHPKFGKIRYVGSGKTDHRPNDYLPGHDFGIVGPWIRKCGGFVPWILIEELHSEMTRSEVYDIETKWIAHFKALGLADKNLKDLGVGGNGGACIGTKRSDETKKLLSERQVARFSRPEEREKISIGSLEAQNRPEVKQKKSIAQKAALAKPEAKAKRAATDALPETIARRADAQKIAFAKPEFRLKQSEIQKEIANRPGERERRSERKKAWWAKKRNA